MKKYIATLIIATTVIIAATIIAKPWITIRQPKPITVKGYATIPATSDSGSLTASVTVQAPSNAQAYTDAGVALKRVEAKVTEILSTSCERVYINTSVSRVTKVVDGKKTNETDYYMATRSIRISTKNVDGLGQLAYELNGLHSEGIDISLDGPEFFVSDLDEVKLELVRKATENGRARAKLMAESSGERLGKLVSATQGVIQITKRDSTETSSWGMYDTQTIAKDVKLAVTLEYEIAR